MIAVFIKDNQICQIKHDNSQDLYLQVKTRPIWIVAKANNFNRPKYAKLGFRRP